MSKNNMVVMIDGVKIDVNFYYTPESQDSWDCPGEDEEIEITSWEILDGEECLSYLSESELLHIMQTLIMEQIKES